MKTRLLNSLFHRRGPATAGPSAGPWDAHRRRAEELGARHPHAAEPLRLYAALLDVWEETWHAAVHEADLTRDTLATWAAAPRVFGKVVTATREHGPPALALALDRLGTDALGHAEALLAAWLADEELVEAEAYLARATLRGPLEALGLPASSGTGQAHRCARCGGPAQLSLRGDSGDRLVNGSRHLECARCLHRWPFTSGACAGCGALQGTKRTIHSEPRTTTVGRRQGDDAVFPHLRMESCGTCRRYLLDVDLGVEPRAVPEVDEIAALPFGLYAARRGLSKITPNLLGY